jgi:hypothetical protein
LRENQTKRKESKNAQIKRKNAQTKQGEFFALSLQGPVSLIMINGWELEP